MCGPLLIPVAIAAVGAAMSMAAESQQQSASVDATNSYNNQEAALLNQGEQQQQQLNAQKNAAFQGSLTNDSLPSQTSQQQSIASTLAPQYVGDTAPASTATNNAANAQAAANPSSTGSRVTQADYDSSQNAVSSYLAQQAQAKAQLDALQQQNVNENLFGATQGQNLSTLGAIQQSAANNTGTQLDFSNQGYQGNLLNAKNSGALLGTVGGLFSGVGSGLASKSAGVANTSAGPDYTSGTTLTNAQVM